MTIEAKLQDYIAGRFGSVTEFCKRSGISSSTIFTVFKRGIMSSSATTILRICQALSISSQALYEGRIESASYDKEKDSVSVDIIDYLQRIESIELEYKGNKLTPQQRRMIVYATKLAVQLSVKEIPEDDI